MSVIRPIVRRKLCSRFEERSRSLLCSEKQKRGFAGEIADGSTIYSREVFDRGFRMVEDFGFDSSYLEFGAYLYQHGWNADENGPEIFDPEEAAVKFREMQSPIPEFDR